MKTHTLEELKLAKAKKCRIEYCDVDDGDWFVVGGDFAEKMSKAAAYKFRIHHADEWKARLPRLREGAEWHRNDFTNEMLEGGFRPLLDGEVIEAGDEVLYYGRGPWVVSSIVGAVAKIGSGFHCHRTRRPVPPEFLHPDELAKQPEAAQAPDFGEPWKLSPLPESEITDNGGCLLDIAQANRGIICTNALAGVPDPAEFVRQANDTVRELVDLCERAKGIVQAKHPNDADIDDFITDFEVVMTSANLQPFLP